MYLSSSGTHILANVSYKCIHVSLYVEYNQRIGIVGGYAYIYAHVVCRYQCITVYMYLFICIITKKSAFRMGIHISMHA